MKGKKTLVLITPLLLFAVLFIPYQWVNQQFLVDWLGCGCPQLDEFGNMIENNFNANNFTMVFWLFVSLCATVWAAFLSKKIATDKRWIRGLYVGGILVSSVVITYFLYQLTMWN